MKIRQAKRGSRRRKDREQQKALRQQRQRLHELEDDIAALEAAVTDLEAQFAAIPPDDYQRAQRLKSEYEGMKGDLAAMYAEWEALVEEAT